VTRKAFTESYHSLNQLLQSLPMSTAAPQPDPRREHLRQQAIQRRQAVLERISGTRVLLVGGAVAASCVLAGYIDASAHTRSTAGTGSSFGSTGSAYGSDGSNSYGSSTYNGGGSSNYNGGGSSNYNGGSSSQNTFGGGSPPSSSLGGGSAVSGGS
jgi:hypothetical protein